MKAIKTEKKVERTVDEIFSIRRRWQLFVIVPTLVILLSLFLIDRDTNELFGLPPYIWAPVILAVIIFNLFYSIANWRCPASNQHLGKGLNPKFCGHFGVLLQKQMEQRTENESEIPGVEHATHLKKLTALRDAGILSDDEFEIKKAAILRRR